MPLPELDVPELDPALPELDAPELDALELDAPELDAPELDPPELGLPLEPDELLELAELAELDPLELDTAPESDPLPLPWLATSFDGGPALVDGLLHAPDHGARLARDPVKARPMRTRQNVVFMSRVVVPMTEMTIGGRSSDHAIQAIRRAQVVLALSLTFVATSGLGAALPS